MRHSRVQVWSEMERIGLVPLFYHHDVKTAVKILDALRSGGATVIEYTNRGDGAVDVFRGLVRDNQGSSSEVLLGVGSVFDAHTAAMYINEGASFVVGAVFNREVAKLCNRRRIAYIPGCATPSEISTAEEYGVEICKLFPGNAVGGPDFVRAILGPSPKTKLMPTGGVETTRESVKAWLEAGAACVGVGSRLIRRSFVDLEDWDAMAQLTAQCLAWIAEIRRGPEGSSRSESASNT